MLNKFSGTKFSYMREKHSEFMLEAIRCSKQNLIDGTGGPFGAVIVKNGKIIAAASNKVTSTNDPTAHAEINAIRLACKELDTFLLEGCEIYSSCEPCPMCLSAIYWARIEKIYYANTSSDAERINFSDEFIYHELAKPRSKRNIAMIQILREKAIEVFEAWDKKEDKIVY